MEFSSDVPGLLSAVDPQQKGQSSPRGLAQTLRESGRTAEKGAVSLGKGGEFNFPSRPGGREGLKS